MVEHMPSQCETLSSSPSTEKKKGRSMKMEQRNICGCQPLKDGHKPRNAKSQVKLDLAKKISFPQHC
jgi:hypothetical protein